MALKSVSVVKFNWVGCAKGGVFGVLKASARNRKRRDSVIEKFFEHRRVQVVETWSAYLLLTAAER